LNCEQVQRELGAYGAGLVGHPQAAQIAAHLLGCETCSRSLEEFRRLDALLRSHRRTASQDLVREALARREAASAWRRWRRQFLLQSLCLLAAWGGLSAALGAMAYRWLPRLLQWLVSWRWEFALGPEPVRMAVFALATGAVVGAVLWIASRLSDVPA
jgi:anti-sigma factor RsiW